MGLCSWIRGGKEGGGGGGGVLVWLNLLTVDHASFPRRIAVPRVEGGEAYSFMACPSRLIIDHAFVSRRSPFPAFGGGGGYSLVACLSHLTIDHAFLSRRSTVPAPDRDTSNIWALVTLLPYTTEKLFAHPIPVLFRRLRPQSISYDNDRFLAAF